MHGTRICLIALAAALASPPAAVMAAPVAGSADTSPAPAATATPRIRVKASPKPLRSAVNLCAHALFYIWPPEGGIPNPADLPPARSGERFEIQAGPRHTLDGHGYYKTTIPTNSGHGFYWVSDRCFDPD